MKIAVENGMDLGQVSLPFGNVRSVVAYFSFSVCAICVYMGWKMRRNGDAWTCESGLNSWGRGPLGVTQDFFG